MLSILFSGCNIDNETSSNISSFDVGSLDCNSANSSIPYRYIAHAGGGIDGYTYINSEEGMNLAYKNGYRMFEVDLMITSDNFLVGTHGWARWREITGSDIEHPSLDDVKSNLILGKYHSITMDFINDFFSMHEDAVLVSDQIRDYELLNKNFKFKERLIAEVFNENDLKNAISAGIKYPLVSYVGSADGFIEIKKNYNIKFAGLHSTVAQEKAIDLSRLKQQDICLFAFSTNEEYFFTSYIPDYIYGVYTDFYLPNSGIFSCKEEMCTSY